MQCTIQTQDPKNIKTDLLIVPLFEGAKAFSGSAAALDRALSGALSKIIAEEKMEGKEGESALHRSAGAIGAAKVLILGAGAKPMNAACARRFAALAVQAARRQKARTVAVLAPDRFGDGLALVGQTLVEGALLGDYRFLKYKSEELKKYQENAITSFALIMPAAKKSELELMRKGMSRGELSSRATIFARELVNEPALEMTPGQLVAAARKIAAANPKRISLKVFDERELKNIGAGGILAVARGSDEPSYLVHLTYKPAGKPRKKVVVVGKGITFDSGGLSLKPSQAMEDMKIDMGGCAAVLGVFSVLPSLAPDVEVHGISGICENMPSGKAIRPGDIVRTMSGKTIEILNTDAEGRVTLADTLHFGKELNPDYLVDLATLTGACMVALGQEVAGMMTNSEKLGKKLRDAAARAGELIWQLPLPDEYRDLMKSKTADLKNISGINYGGAITAGLFLEEFVGKTPWAHLDIAGPAWAEREAVPHQPLGATGFGVRTMLEFIEKL